MKKTRNILIVDDELTIASFLSKIIENDRNFNCNVSTVTTGEDALDLINKNKFDLILCDIKLPTMNGIEVLTRVKKIDPSIYIIMMTGFASIDTAIKAIRKGAYNYINKPFEAKEILTYIKNALSEKILIEEKAQILSELEIANKELKVKQIELQNHLKLRIFELEKLENLTSTLNNSVSYATLIKMIPKLSTLICESDGAFLAWYNEISDTLTIRSSFGCEDLFIRGSKLDVSYQPFDMIYTNRKYNIIKDYFIGRKKKIALLAAASLFGGNKPFGLIVLVYKNRDKDIETKLPSLLTISTEIISLAFKNSQFFETIKKQELEVLSFVLYLAEIFGCNRKKLQKTTKLTVEIAKNFNIDEKLFKPIRYATLFLILSIKFPGIKSLDAATEKAYRFISQFENLSTSLKVVKYVAENFDGSGRNNFTSDMIPVESRIIRVVIDFMFIKNKNPIQVIEKNQNKLYDPIVVKFLKEIVK